MINNRWIMKQIIVNSVINKMISFVGQLSLQSKFCVSMLRTYFVYQKETSDYTLYFFLDILSYISS